MKATFDRVAWKRRAAAAKALEKARDSGDAEQVRVAEAEYWRECDASPLYPADR